MNVVPELFTLGGVALGALASYPVGSLTERARDRRDVSSRWEGCRFDAYAAYIADAKDQVVIANRISASLSLHTRLTSQLSQQEGLPILAEIATRRSTSSERAVLLADAAGALCHLCTRTRTL